MEGHKRCIGVQGNPQQDLNWKVKDEWIDNKCEQVVKFDYFYKITRRDNIKRTTKKQMQCGQKVDQ